MTVKPTYRVFYYHNTEDHDWTFTFNEIWMGPGGSLSRVNTKSVGPMGDFASELKSSLKDMRAKLEMQLKNAAAPGPDGTIQSQLDQLEAMERAIELPHLDWTRLSADVEFIQ